MRDGSSVREPHCRRIMSALLPAAELLLRVLDLGDEHWESEMCILMRHALQQARSMATWDSEVHEDLVSKRKRRD